MKTGRVHIQCNSYSVNDKQRSQGRVADRLSVYIYIQIVIDPRPERIALYTVEPLNKGHFGTSGFCP